MGTQNHKQSNKNNKDIMTVLEQHKKKGFAMNTLLKVKTSNLIFKDVAGLPKFKEGYIFASIDGDFWFRQAQNSKKFFVIDSSKCSISNIEVIERIN